VLRLPATALKAVARPVAGAAGAADLVDTMRAYDHCVGLAAPQIGVGLRAFCLDVTGHPRARSCAGLVVLFDPEVVAAGATNEPYNAAMTTRRRGPGNPKGVPR
jgi:peptide deformylase